MVVYIRCISLFEDTEDLCVKFCILIIESHSKDLNFFFNPNIYRKTKQR